MRYLILLLVIACTKETEVVTQPPKEVTNPPIVDSPRKDCAWVETKRDTIKDKNIDENSGMVWFDNTLFIINDSGGYSGYFACTPPYTDCKKFAVNIKNEDFEGMAKYQDRIVIADSGNDWNKNPINITYCVPNTTTCISHKAHFPNGGRDVETFLIDPLTGNEFFITKLYDKKDPEIYKLEAGKTDMSLVGTYKYNLVSGHKMKVLSDGAFSPDGSKFIMTEIDGKDTTVMVECRFNLSDVTENTLDKKVKDFCKTFEVKSLGQIESLTFVDDNTFVYSSEGANSPLVTMTCK